jgi:hypothetical protein
MIPRQRRIIIALLLAVCVPVLTATAQTPQRPATAKNVILSTKTPLGEASIVMPAGTEVVDPVGGEKEVTLRKGPFSATVAREDLVFPASSPSATAGTSDGGAPPAPSPAATSQPAVSWNDPDAVTSGQRWFEDWRILVPVVAAVLLGLYSIFATVALVRRAKRHEYDD